MLCTYNRFVRCFDFMKMQDISSIGWTLTIRLVWFALDKEFFLFKYSSNISTKTASVTCGSAPDDTTNSRCDDDIRKKIVCKQKEEKKTQHIRAVESDTSVKMKIWKMWRKFSSYAQLSSLYVLSVEVVSTQMRNRYKWESERRESHENMKNIFQMTQFTADSGFLVWIMRLQLTKLI